MNEFGRFHPIVNLIFFAAVIIFSMVFMHPVCLAVSLFSAFGYDCLLKGKSAVKTNLMIFLPVMLLSMIINPLFNHMGVTILFYLNSGNPITLEALMYGLASGAMLSSMFMWFICYNFVFTTDKFIYLFGKIIPSLSLVISMTLRFIPKLKTKLKSVIAGQKCIGKTTNKAKSGINILSILTTWALEDSVDSADSMKNRGYGLPGRTAFSVYKFDLRDLIVLLLILISAVVIIINYPDFNYYPVITGEVDITFFIEYLLLCNIPLIIELWEGMRWKYLKSKI